MTGVALSRSLAGMALFFGLVGLVLVVALALPAGRAWVARELGGAGRALLGLAWFVAAAATAGSLYYSNVVGFEPCVLCWYQRIAMYPLVLLLGVAFLAGDPRVWRYGLPLTLVGLGIAVYHVALQYRPALDVGACAADVPCTLRYVSAFGYVTIPGMAAASFVAVTGFLLAARTVSGASGGSVAGDDGPP